jgi:hypothetical protein
MRITELYGIQKCFYHFMMFVYACICLYCSVCACITCILYVHACITCICMANQSASHGSPGASGWATGQWEGGVTGQLGNVNMHSVQCRADSSSVESSMSLSAAGRQGQGRGSCWATGGQGPASQPVTDSQFTRGTGPNQPVTVQ